MKLYNIKPAEGATKTRKRLGRGIGSGTGKLVVKVIKDKTLVVVVELDQDLKEDNYLYSDVYQKEDLVMLCLK